MKREDPWRLNRGRRTIRIFEIAEAGGTCRRRSCLQGFEALYRVRNTTKMPTGQKNDNLKYFFYSKEIEEQAPEYGLNSKLKKDKDGKIYEETYKIGGMYGEAIKEIVYWIEKAKEVAENEDQRKSFDLLINYYNLAI